MITKTYGSGTRQVTMELKADCGWPMESDVYISQVWIQHGKRERMDFVDLTLAEAEALIPELQAAIAECKRRQAQYDEYIKENPELP